MNGPLVVGDSGLGTRVIRFRGLNRFRRGQGLLLRSLIDGGFNRRFRHNQSRRLRWLDRRCCGHRGRLLSPWRRHFGMLVLVLSVTRGAARLLHRVFDHRDNRMIGDAALARTVVV